MFKELKALEYALEIIRVLIKREGVHESRSVAELLRKEGRIPSVSTAYVQKVLPKLVNVGIMASSLNGYELILSADEITVDKILSICAMPFEDSPMSGVCKHICEAVSLTELSEFYDLSSQDQLEDSV